MNHSKDKFDAVRKKIHILLTIKKQHLVTYIIVCIPQVTGGDTNVLEKASKITSRAKPKNPINIRNSSVKDIDDQPKKEIDTGGNVKCERQAKKVFS